jgi:putative transposase
MVRPLRIEFPGAVYHAGSRGNGGQAIFLDSRDRVAFLDLIGEVVSRFGLLVHAYCLMGNHYHLVVETPRGELGRPMRQLNGVYAKRFNRRHRTVGHLFQARYGAGLIEREAHLLEVCRYVVLNPVRARLCEHPGEWPWSSYLASAGLAAPPAWLCTTWTLAQFGGRLTVAQERYRRFVLDGIGLPPPEPLAGLYQGSTSFALRLAPGGTIPEVPRRHTRPVRAPLEELLADGSDAAIAAAYRDHGYTLTQIGGHLGRHYTTISRRLRRWETAA